MIFKIIGVKDSKQKIFYYDNMENYVYDEEGTIFEAQKQKNKQMFSKRENYTVFSKDIPLKKSNEVTKLKIQLGLTCNYSCEYCSQRFVPRAEETSRKHIDSFLEKLKFLTFDENRGLSIEFWGGEPFLYWKTLKPLVAALQEKFSSWNKKPRFSIITNGSLLTEEICDWFVENIQGGAISHDGPGQYVRGPDPFDDPKQLKLMIDLYKRMNGQFSFNSMLNYSNMSRKAIAEWFKEKTGIQDIKIGEGSFVDAYDEGAIAQSLNSKKKAFEFRKLAFKEIYEDEEQNQFGFGIIKMKVEQAFNGMSEHTNACYLTQKCGMDDEHTVAVDLLGNVLTCQNVSAVAINANGESHLGGNITDMESVSITTSTHWSQRKECKDCPVLHICQGSCMYASEQYWEQSCENSFSDNVVFFASAFEKLTGYIPIFFDNDVLPDHRKDIWGDILEHKEEKKKQIPISIPVRVEK